MKKVIFTITGILLILIFFYFTWAQLPLEIQRRSEIKKGNLIVNKLNDYKLTQGHFPETGDWKSLEKLGFTMTELGTKPDYEKLSDTSFMLTYLEGFDGPYLRYKSSTRKWSVE